MANKHIPESNQDFQIVMIADPNGNLWDPVGPSAVSSASEYFRSTTVGTIALGAFSVAVINSGEADGTFAGAALRVGDFPPAFEAAPGTRLAAIAYDATGTEFTFAVVR